MEKVLSFFRNVLGFHKFKIFLVIISSFAFFIWLFPLSDLGDLVTRQVSQATGNKVFVQFEEMSFDLWPQLGVGMTEVEVDTPDAPTIQADYLSLAPSIMSLLAFKAGFNLKAQGFLGGDLSLGFQEGKATEAGDSTQEIDLEVEGIALKALLRFLEAPVDLLGNASLETELKIDPSLRDQPDGDIALTGKTIKFPSTSLTTQMGPVNLPSLSWSDVQLKGRMNSGKLTIEKGRIGVDKNPLRAKLKGSWEIRLERRGGQVVPNLGPYDFKVDLVVKKEVEKDLSLALFLLDKVKTKTFEGSRYLFRISGTSVRTPPRIESITAL